MIVPSKAAASSSASADLPLAVGPAIRMTGDNSDFLASSSNCVLDRTGRSSITDPPSMAPCSPRSRPRCAAFGGGLRPVLTTAVRGALGNPGRDGETVLGRTKKHASRYRGYADKLIAYPGVENDRELAHAGDESDLGRLAVASQPAIKLFDRRVAAHRAEGCHVEHVAHPHPPAGDSAVPAHLAAVMVERGDPDQGGRLMTAQSAEFAHVGDQRTGQHQTDPLKSGDTGKQRLLGRIVVDDRAHL